MRTLWLLVHGYDSTPSSILGGIPAPKPCDAIASMRAVFACCELTLTACPELGS